jgi:hypothetical protein
LFGRVEVEIAPRHGSHQRELELRRDGARFEPHHGVRVSERAGLVAA